MLCFLILSMVVKIIFMELVVKIIFMKLVNLQ